MHTYIHTQTHIHTYTHTHIHIYIRTYKHTRIHTYIHAYIHTYIQTDRHTYIFAYMHIYIYTYIHTSRSIYPCMHVYIYMYIYTYMHIYIYTYIHIYICNVSTFASSEVQVTVDENPEPKQAKVRRAMRRCHGGFHQSGVPEALCMVGFMENHIYKIYDYWGYPHDFRNLHFTCLYRRYVELLNGD